MKTDLKECKDCKKPVSQSAKTCPNCGLPKPVRRIDFMSFSESQKAFLAWFFGSFMLLFSLLLFSESPLASAFGFFAALISIPPTGKLINQFLKSKYRFAIGKKLKVIVCFALFIFLMSAIPQTSKQINRSDSIIPEQQSQKTPEQIEVEKIEKQFSPWDGRHMQLYNFLKENLRDPNSLEHVETSYKRKKDAKNNYSGVIVVNMKYRAKNGFGGYNVELISADCDLDGNILKINKYVH
jgi:hypothetical protein